MASIEQYGGGPSTGLDQTALGKITTGLVPEDVVMSQDDADVLRVLAEKVALLAGGAAMAERRVHWKAVNALQRVRPVIFCDPENGWNEIITAAQMQCKGALARRWEMNLRKEIFWGEVMGDDKPVEACFEVPYTAQPDHWGLDTVFHRSAMKDGAESWDGPVQDYDRDLPKLHAPDVLIDWETTNGCLQLAEDVFGGILDVRLKGTWWWSLGITLPAVHLRGMTNMLTDFLDQPDNLKALFARIAEGHLQKLDYLEAHGLLSLNNDGTYVGSGGFGFTDELPRPGFSGAVTCADMWGFAESQETVGVSPQMFAEFVLPYQLPLLARFGLNCYGCCEPLDKRWDYVKQIPRLRRVSVSPWSNRALMAERLGAAYVLSMKPNPADLARDSFDEARIRTLLRADLQATRDCRVEVIMKDNHTIRNDPQRVTRWVQIAREEAEHL